ncbi:EpsG family protein [Pectobacterium carotovorum]|uniref:EpsG family protein n=1 Tax=Pectobacterium carotovorum TaxID=554 RepID=UPI000E724F7C|nr:EpsG family protein [Pectobacterium carotovorum]RJL38793.1 EpsG family protein [Pectobacterium carotovorum]
MLLSNEINQNKYKAIKFTILIVMFVFTSYICGFRLLGDDNDYYAYRYFYQSIGSNYSNLDSRYEIGYVIYAFLAKYRLDLTFPEFVVLSTTLAFFLKLLIFKDLRYSLFLFFLYIISFGLLHETTQIRAAFGLGFGFLALHAKSENKNVRALLLFFLAVSFHSSAFILGAALFVPLRILNLLSSNKILFIIGFLIIDIVVILSIKMLMIKFPMIEYYAGGDFEGKTFNLFSAMYLGSIFLILIAYKYALAFDEFSLRCYFISAVGVILVPALISIPVVAHRIFELSEVSTFMWITSIRNIYVRVMCLLLFSLLAIYFFMRNYFIFPIFT